MGKVIRTVGIFALLAIPFNWALWTSKGPGWELGTFVLGIALLLGFLLDSLSSRPYSSSDYVVPAFLAVMLNFALSTYHTNQIREYGWPSTITEVREVDTPLIADKQPDYSVATAFAREDRDLLLGGRQEPLYPTSVKGKLLFLYRASGGWRVITPEGKRSKSFDLKNDFVKRNHSTEGLYPGEEAFELDDEGTPHLIQPLYTAPGYKGAGKLISIWVQNMETGEGYYQYHSEASDWIDHVGVSQQDLRDEVIKPVLGINGRLYYIEDDGGGSTAVVDPRKRIKTSSTKSVTELVRDVLE